MGAPDTKPVVSAVSIGTDTAFAAVAVCIKVVDSWVSLAELIVITPAVV
jgi:hypothetical protein